MSDRSDSHEMVLPASGDSEAPHVESSSMIERQDEATKEQLPVLGALNAEEDANIKTEPPPVDDWGWMWDIDYGQLAAKATHSLCSDLWLIQLACYRKLFHEIRS